MDQRMPDRFAAKAFTYEHGGFREGYVIAEGGVIVEEDEGPCPERTDIQLALFPDVVNAHTHCADYGLKVPAGMSLEDLVAPPDGLKHRYLRDTPGEVLSENMRRFGEASASHGSSAFVDFRENGAEGCRLLREACPDAVILGRPVSPEFDPGEI
ncbi:MAG: amidohydrolase family protein, partial [Candidatus Methanomethylophilaceae archaeon]|nr:amidohydrolase family protein [Candidatus Methanomethylophilaceae archaeon]